LNHANPERTFRTYAHVMLEEESDVSLANFGGSKRLYPAAPISAPSPTKTPPV
jgi:hypothetical protein